MRPDDINKVLRRQPFQPFRVHLSNGQTFEIRHPELALVGRSTMVIGLPAPDLPPTTYDLFEIIALMHINRLEPLPAATPSTTNGTGAQPQPTE
jgi:hypothetical protein